MTISDDLNLERPSQAKSSFPLLTFLAGRSTRPVTAPFSADAPEGLALVLTASTASEAEWLRQVLLDAGFHVEYVATPLTGVFGTSGSVNVYVQSDQQEEAREFLARLRQFAADESDSISDGTPHSETAWETE